MLYGDSGANGGRDDPGPDRDTWIFGVCALQNSSWACSRLQEVLIGATAGRYEANLVVIVVMHSVVVHVDGQAHDKECGIALAEQKKAN